jgi:hypothetical protein
MVDPLLYHSSLLRGGRDEQKFSSGIFSLTRKKTISFRDLYAHMESACSNTFDVFPVYIVRLPLGVFGILYAIVSSLSL